MTNPGPDIEQRIRRIEHGLEQVGSLLVPLEISDGVKKAITLSNIDPDMALGRARKVLDFIVSDLYKREFGRSPGTQPLENSVQQLAKAGKLPRTMLAYANSVRELGNVGIHGSGEAISADDVVSSLENLMRLVAWYCEQVRPGSEDNTKPAPPPIEKDNAEVLPDSDDPAASERDKKLSEPEHKQPGLDILPPPVLEEEQPKPIEPPPVPTPDPTPPPLPPPHPKPIPEPLPTPPPAPVTPIDDQKRKEQESFEEEKKRKQQSKRSRRRLVVLLLAACLLGVAVWWVLAVARPAAQERAFLKHKYDGVSLLASGKYDEANAELLSAYSLGPKDPYILYSLGEVQSHLAQWGLAIDYYRRALRENPDANYAQIALGNALLQSGDIDGAIAQYKDVLAKDGSILDSGSLGEIHANYGSALLSKGDIAGASTEFGLAAKADPAWRSHLRDRIKMPGPSH